MVINYFMLQEYWQKYQSISQTRRSKIIGLLHLIRIRPNCQKLLSQAIKLYEEEYDKFEV